MYLTFFGLAEKPFAITPDPRYLYLGARHADALAHLVYGINEAGGFIQLTGEVGTGKTTTIRSLLARAPKNAEIALILNPKLSPLEFLRSLCEELGLGVSDSAESNSKELVDQLNRYLLRAHAQGRRVVLIVDEAQNLDPEVLEQIRLLTNLETETQKLLQIILIGQPELRRLLAREDLRQLAQRITGRYHLDPLSREETAAYVRHRLRVAGATRDVFTRAALFEIYRVSGGIPRLINIVCDRALLGAYTQDLHQVTATLVRRAGAEVFGHELTPAWMPLLLGAVAAVVLAGSAAVLWRYGPLGRWSELLHSSARAVHSAATAPQPTQAEPGPTATVAAVETPTTASTSSQAAAAPAGAALPGGQVAASQVSAPMTAAAARGVPAKLTELLVSYRASTDADSAFSTLLRLWKAHYERSSTDGCTQALEQGLQCLMQRGSLAQLRLLNRPAILMLTDDAGGGQQVVLRALGEETATLQLGDHVAAVGLADLSRYWFGDFVLLWHPVAKDARGLRSGMHGAPVRRLRYQLTRWSGAPDNNAAGDEYDSSLVQLVEQFQHAHRLTVDGIAGVETQVALDAALAPPDSPVLARAAEADPPRG
jgi:general secretion pathway protein A